ncbi:Protein cTAGE-2 [Tupaia chinensis]|uniref:Protein cTAGE-2 n=1 Tax=Tupaia chinensis TaxID=246437 RepID=L9L3J2_TUPCH|nr:Protein cTAGE-2 [Tupaia chinensis]
MPVTPYPSDINLKCIIDEGDVHVSCDCQDNGEMARQLQEGTAIIEELTAQIQHLQTEQRCLHLEIAQLDSDNQNLELRLETLPKLHGDHMTKLMREANDEEEHCSELYGDLSKVTADRACTEKVHNFHRKVVADLKRELEATTSSCREHLCFYEKRLQDSWSAALLVEKKLTELRAKNEHTRRLLADVEFGVLPSPSRPFVPAAPPAAHRGPEVPGSPLGHQVPLKGGHPLRD